METSHNERNMTHNSKKSRAPEIDIVNGASQTNQLDALYKNAKRTLSEPLPKRVKTDKEENSDYESPATRGI